MKKKIKVMENGPYHVSGKIPLSKEVIGADDAGNSVEWKKGDKFPDKESYDLCRCGGSCNKPYCDGSHSEIDFIGLESASREPYRDQAAETDGPTLSLTDAEVLCAAARFCHNKVGRVWELTEASDDLKARKEAIKQACDCPSGRLVISDKKSGEAIEPKFHQSISLVEDPPRKVSGPLWVKGKIPIESADGTVYEVRNRVTLCRCGKSNNKPFCDGAHISCNFSDGDESIQ
jgi:CDGSH-type Zn-finger protein